MNIEKEYEVKNLREKNEELTVVAVFLGIMVLLAVAISAGAL